MEKRECYGILNRVFPVGPGGLREVVPACFECPLRVECLRAALKTEEGLEMRSEKLEGNEPGSFVGRLKRWSEKKALNRRIHEQRKTKE